MSNIKVLFASAEAVPFIKTGGLADVTYSLPKALRKLGIDVRVILPKYSQIPEEFKEEMVTITDFPIEFKGQQEDCEILYLEYDEVPYYFVGNGYHFEQNSPYQVKGGSIYEFKDSEKFAFFNKAILETIRYIDFKPDIIHSNDWHTGMISVLLNQLYCHEKDYSNIKTIFTIHNLQYQGIFPKEILKGLFGLEIENIDIEKLEFYGDINFMKAGINYSDIVTTVSKTYSKEIQTPEYGEKLDGLLRKIGDRLYGILNGIDYDMYNPETDKDIYVQYSVDSIDKKLENKLKLQKELGLPERKDVPVISLISRLVNMKGIDILIKVLNEILSLDIQFVILGTGEPFYESILKEYEYKYPEKLSVNILFDNKLAKKIYAGSDIFLMPSLFEPCGLGQMIALRYGTLPIVRKTGGLNDTVKLYNVFTDEGNGFSFTNYDAYDMLYTIKRAVKFYNDKKVWNKLVKRAMERDYSWKNSAKEYEKVYKTIYN
ncbi:glycogen synthase GlgA [Thermohalobacter berrensis]|uniref:Glycogen synthase n=1 Tax=Thermohalobacter berrensis TaxID=99594 RepID=A0A419T0A1_9FIRM|nr:glycogen synthase GlgA [Thermohalobacter berrensis]RKD30873.1 starch synthase [Thermohalobacter berrensis]